MSELVSWMLDAGRVEEDEATFIGGLASQLLIAGIPLIRLGAVNEVESLCKQLEVPLLVTRPFAEASGRGDLRWLGTRPLAGVAHPPEIATLDRFTPP